MACAAGTIPAATAAAAPPLDPPGHAVEVPGVARRPEQCGLGSDSEAELRSIGFSEDAQAATLIARDQLGVVVREIRCKEAAAIARDCTLDSAFKSFRRNGTPLNGPSGTP